jgi:hypothetical protein
LFNIVLQIKHTKLHLTIHLDIFVPFFDSFFSFSLPPSLDLTPILLELIQINILTQLFHIFPLHTLLLQYFLNFVFHKHLCLLQLLYFKLLIKITTVILHQHTVISLSQRRMTLRKIHSIINYHLNHFLLHQRKWITRTILQLLVMLLVELFRSRQTHSYTLTPFHQIFNFFYMFSLFYYIFQI